MAERPRGSPGLPGAEPASSSPSVPPPPPPPRSAPSLPPPPSNSAIRATNPRPSLPVLAPARKEDASLLPKGKRTIDASDIDIELESAGEDDPLAAVGLPSKLTAICTYGRYEVLGRIAFGGMAEIFLGRESMSVGASRYLVIKRVLPQVADDPVFVDMFLDEARLAIQLNHPNICHIYEFGELDGSYFIAMEWVNGVTLGKLIRKARLIGGIAPELAVRIAAQVADALHYAHRARDGEGRPMGIVHRDVSPHNIMVAYDGQVKLLDFGIAKASSQVTKTENGIVKGKFSYMAPEQCLGKPLDGRTDVFALGICLYEALTGNALYTRQNEYETMRAVIQDVPPSIRAARPELPASLDEIVQKALAKEPSDRFATAGEMQTALERWLAQARKVVNAASVADMMEDLYEEQIRRGPLVDSTPFGQSFQRAKPLDSAAHAVPSTASIDAAPPPRKAWVNLVIGVGLMVLGLAAGAAIFYRPHRDARAAAVAPSAPIVERETPPPIPSPPAAIPTPEPSYGRARIESTPSGATLRIDDEVYEGETPITIAELAPGPHRLVIERAGYRRWEGDLAVTANAETPIRAVLVPIVRAPVAPPGRLSINTRPWSKVYVGSRLLGTTPIAEASVPSGNVRLRLVDRDGATHARTVQVPASGNQRVFFDLAER